MKHNQETYRQWCAGTSGIPLFMQPYWLDAVIPDRSWSGVVARANEDRMRAAWSINLSRQRRMKAIVAPPLTPYTGIWLDLDQTLSAQKQSAQRQTLVAALEDQLPVVAIFEQKLHPSLQDWMPFYWKGYRQETRYTFRFDCRQVDEIYAQFSDSFRRNIRAAERKFDTALSTDIPELFGLIAEVFRLRKQPVPFTLEQLQHVWQVMSERGQCAIYRASDERGVNSAILVVWDAHTTYYLLGGRSGSNTRSSSNLLLWRAIQDAGQRGHVFDFEGSMIQGVHAFFQSFGAYMQPYLFIYRYTGLARLKYLWR
ncbi:MAG: GNAT family N-acetyltransferase [Saprospiraceae bacterium]|nr:GNAT family N-acetyltransferase [Saprospiraceae bacterium]